MMNKDEYVNKFMTMSEADQKKKLVQIIKAAEKARDKAEAAMPTMTPKEIAEAIKAKFVTAATEVANDAHGESVAKEIVNDLNKQKRAVTLRLLGLDSRYGREWEVDHCNGRESPITKYLAEESQETIRAWVNEAVQEVLTTELKSKIMTAAKGALKKEIERQVRDNTGSYRLGEQAKPLINALFQQAADEVREELGLTKKGE
jgi:hypothetical protein